MASQDTATLLKTAYRDLEQGALDRAESTYRRLLEDSGHRADALNGLGLVAMLRGQMDKAIKFLRQILETTPDHAAARLNLVKALMIEGQRMTSEGRLENAATMLETARKEVVREDAGAIDATCRIPLGRMFGALGVEYQSQRRDFPHAIEMLRLARSLAPEDADLRIELDMILHGTVSPATLRDYTDQIAESEFGTHLLVACFPKSGSTFLKKVLVQVTGFPEQHLTFAHGQNDTGIYLPDLVNAARNDTVTQLHLRATNSNINLMQGFSVRPIILVRNLFDVLLSYKEHHDKFAKEQSFYDQYESLDEDQRLDLIVDDRAAWYIGFFAGWQRAVRDGRIEGMWLTYEELMRDKVGKTEEILRFYGLDRPRQVIADAIEKVGENKAAIRFNKGVSGRGQSQFTDDHRAQITRIAGYHPDIDFSLIGL